MVKLPPLATALQALSVYKVAPVEVEAAVKAWPPAPAVTGFPRPSCICTVTTPPAPPQTPAVYVLAAVVNTSCDAVAAFTVSTCGVGLVSEELKEMDGLPDLVSL